MGVYLIFLELICLVTLIFIIVWKIKKYSIIFSLMGLIFILSILSLYYYNYCNRFYEDSKKHHFAIYEMVNYENLLHDSNLQRFIRKDKPKPVITDEDIKYYNWSNHTFHFNNDANNYISKIKYYKKDFRTFVLVVDGHEVYNGGFYYDKLGPNIYLTITQNGGSLLYKGVNGYDLRSDKHIYNVFKKLGKLNQ
ncbi:hypothetical protein [Clostridium aciditolerans]|nr:hypothetical protein [Clostridium aciditolerans]